MKIFIPNESKQGIGGGWSFIRNFTKYAVKQGHEVVVGPDPSLALPSTEICFIAGATMAKRETIEKAKAIGMKIVLRVDNAPKNSRNRNTGTSRLKDFADMADLVVYQSNWARNYLGPWLGTKGKDAVILNGVDEEVFTPEGSKQPKDGKYQYGYIQYNRDETKRWHEAWFRFSMLFRNRPDDLHLWIIGNFSEENQQYNFDFFMGEKYRYIGVLDNPEDVAEYLRSIDVLLLPYYNDACSNTLIEARLCGVRRIKQNQTGGNREIMEASLEDLKASTMARKYVEAFSAL